jgi:hypothetical protein
LSSGYTFIPNVNGEKKDFLNSMIRPIACSGFYEFHLLLEENKLSVEK